jgi:uncharacterized membrane protein YhaH (DUF805 family)
MVNLLLSPQGRIGAGPFWQGVIVLIILGVILSAISAYGPPAASLVGILALLLVYPWLCVFGKRLHDAGKSAWWFLAALAAYLILSSIGYVVLFYDEMMQMQGVQFGTPEYVAQQRQFAQDSFLLSQACSAVVSLVVSFFVGRLASDPSENRFGPPTTAGAEVAA